MRKRLFVAIVVVLLGGLLLAQIALAMSSTNYRLGSFTPLTGGGGAASSTHYAVNLTVGQTAIGASTSTNYQAGLGYWYGVGGSYQVYLPLILK
jgi:hypothetical protein